MALSFIRNDLKDQPSWLLFLTFLGVLSILKPTITLLKWFYLFFLRPGKDLRRSYGTWAVLTGATDGIGKSIAFELSRKGLNMVLIGRNPNKLREVSEAINGEDPNVKVRNVVFDLGGDITGGLVRLREAIDGLDVGLLVNGAGLGEPNAMFFHEVEIELWMEMIRVNLVALTEITMAVLPAMLKREGRRSAILNIGSGSTLALPSYPLYAIYASTKDCVKQFSKGLYFEYKNRGIDVQCQAPLYVATKMVSDVSNKVSYFVASPEEYAKVALRWIGYEPICMPYFPHFLQWCFASCLPHSILYKHRLSKSLKKRSIKLGLESQKDKM